MNTLSRDTNMKYTKEKAMKVKLLYILLGCLLAAGSATAKTVVYSGNLADETGLGVDTNYTLDLQSKNIDEVSAIVAASSSTISSTPGPSPFQGFADGGRPPNCTTPSANPTLSTTSSGKA